MQRTAALQSAAQPARLTVSSLRISTNTCFVVPRRHARCSRAVVHIPKAADIHAAADQAPSTHESAVKPAVEATSSSNGSVQAGTAKPEGPADAGQARSGSPSWEGTSTGEETDWVGQKPFTWRDIDWGECDVCSLSHATGLLFWFGMIQLFLQPVCDSPCSCFVLRCDSSAVLHTVLQNICCRTALRRPRQSSGCHPAAVLWCLPGAQLLQ